MVKVDNNVAGSSAEAETNPADNLSFVETENKPAQKMSRKCKFWIACCSITAVLLAVMIPVGLFVIAPKIGQSAIDWTSIHIANNTIYASPSNGPGAYNGMVHNTQNLHSPIFIGAKVHEVNVTLVANTPGAVGPDAFDTYGFSNGPIGWFTQPETKVTQGDNWMSFDTPIHFNSTADHGYRFASWSFWAWLSDVAYIDLVAEPTLTAFGFITMKTKMRKTIACNCIPHSQDACVFPKAKPTPDKVPNSTFEEDPSYYEPLFDNATIPGAPEINDTVDTLPVFSVFCEPVGTDVYNGSDNMPNGSTTTPTPGSKFSVTIAGFGFSV